MEYKFKPFQKVLVRDYEGEIWKCSLYSHKENIIDNQHFCIIGQWRFCIPYEGNEHLLGTTDSPAQKHKYKYGEVIEVKCADGVWRKGIVIACDGDGTKENGIVKFIVGSTLIAHSSTNDNFEIRPLAEDK